MTHVLAVPPWVDSSPSQLSKVMFRLSSDSGYSPAVNSEPFSSAKSQSILVTLRLDLCHFSENSYEIFLG
jgi:hypothetical protein